MIDLYTWPTPNGRKISILLEELKVNYNVILVNLDEGEQFSKEFTKISPNNKIPAIVDNEKNLNIFESGAIMLYLAKKYNNLIPKQYYWSTMEWFFFQTSQVGPFLGQAHQFLFYNAGKSKFAENKYKDYVKRVYDTLEDRLKNKDYLATEYSIADIATWPWVARFEKHKLQIQNYPNVLKWYKLIAKRPEVIRGYNAAGNNSKIPLT